MPNDALPTPDAIRTLPLKYGSWRTLKSLYKQLEANPSEDISRLGALIARLDAAQADPYATPEALKFKNARYLPILETADGRLLWGLGGDGWRDRNLQVYQLDAERLKTERLASKDIGAEVKQIVPLGSYCIAGQSDKTGTWLITWKVSGKDVTRVAAEKVDAPELKAVVRSGSLLCVLTGGKSPELLVYTLSEGGVLTRQSALSLDSGANLWSAVGGVIVHQSGRGLSLKGLPRAEGISFIDLSDPARPKQSNTITIKPEAAIGGDGFIAVLPESNRWERTCHVYSYSGDTLTETGKCTLDYISGEVKAITLGRRAIFATSYNSRCVFVDDKGVPKIERWRIGPEGAVCTGNGLIVCTGNWQGGRVWQQPLASQEARPVQLGAAPSGPTIGYMKRRTRRLLKTLAKTGRTAYVELAHATLKASDGFDLNHNWALAEVIYGGGGRLRQAHHGRGVVSLTPGPSLNLRRREELCPEAWDARPELSESIYTDPKAGWGAREMVARQLRVAKRKLPSVPDAALIADLASPSALLQALAVRVAIQKVQNGTALSSALLGHVWFRAGRANRAKLEPGIASTKNPAEFCKALASHLSETPTSARERAALALLAERFPEVAGPQMQSGWLVMLLDGGGALRELALARLRTLKHGEVEDWLSDLEGVKNVEAREAALDVLAEVMRKGGNSNVWWWQWKLINNDNNGAFTRAAWWRFLAVHKVAAEAAPIVWRALLSANVLTSSLETAMTSPHALALLAKYIPNEEFQQALQERPFLVAALDAKTFKSLSQTLSLDVVLRLSAAASDASWGRLRRGLLQNLVEGIRLLPFWEAVERALPEAGGEVLEARLLNDDEFANTLLGLTDGEVLLGIRAVAFGPLLGRWAERHQEMIGESDSLRLLAATHSLSEIRAIGVAEVAKRPLTMPFALHLLESEVPDAIKLGAGYFDNLPPGGLDEYGAALALCDSPARSVRARGREFVTARQATLPAEQILTSLLEHDDPEMQDFVAETGAEIDAPAFDAAVLKTRRRARRAKEKIKARQEARPTMDTAALLVLARQKTSPKDAEWALSQLVKRALAGEVIDGMEIAQ
ncbi:MAG: hypothetical protein QM758_00945 [Armatimonas sp.]